MIYWIEFENPEGKRNPKWFRILGLTKDLNVLIPLDAFTDMPDIVSVMASDDGVPRYTHDGHIYVPAVWVIGTFPSKAEIAMEMVKGAYKSKENNRTEIFNFFKGGEK